MPHLWLVFLVLLAQDVRAAEVIPPPPANHFNDYANVVSSAVAQELDQKLSQFEKDTSNQVVVVVYPRMQSDSSIEDYTVRVAQRWGVGNKQRDNGIVLFVFIQDRAMYIQVGYGLEGALPDALAKQIIENEIVPRFKQNDYAGGLRGGVNAILAATRGEYKATPRSTRSARDDRSVPIGTVIFFIFVVLFIISVIRSGRATTYSRRGRSSVWPIIFSSGGWGGGGGRGRGGGGGFRGGGGFSGGGGSFGGGGAGGRW